MQTTEVCLVRHGETEWNAAQRIQGCSDVPLNERGVQQARSAAARLAREPWDLIVTSPLSRALDTAREIASAIGYSPSGIETDDRLVERSFGEAEGMNYTERRSRFGSTREIPGSEPWDDVAIRGERALLDLVRDHAGKRIVIAAHGGLINATLGRLTAGEYGYHRGGIQNGGMTLLTFDGEWRVRYYNQAPLEESDGARQSA